jgi:hypothetical protein
VLQFLDEKSIKNTKITTVNKDPKEKILRTKIDPGLIIILFRIGVKTPESELLEVVINFLK